MDLIVLQKYMASCGVASRRKCQDLIAQGKVSINGKIANLGAKINPGKDSITIEGKKLEFTRKNNIYIMLYKPRGFVTTLNDELGRKCVAQLVSDLPRRIFPVGRLDKDSEGLLLMTNDGDFANKVIHPSKNIWKTYILTVKPNVNEEHLTQLCVGMTIEDKLTHPARVELLNHRGEKSVIEISIQEGRNRQIRKMCEKLGLEVLRLKRVSIGSLKLGSLAPGKWRELKKEELKHFLK